MTANRRRIVGGAAGVSAATSLVLIVSPTLFGRLIFGGESFGHALMFGRTAGFALLALAVACWPEAAQGAPPVRALLSYNLLATAYLGWLGLTAQATGLLLWPGVALHLVLTVLLAGVLRTAGRGRSRPARVTAGRG